MSNLRIMNSPKSWILNAKTYLMRALGFHSANPKGGHWLTPVGSRVGDAIRTYFICGSFQTAEVREFKNREGKIRTTMLYPLT